MSMFMFMFTTHPKRKKEKNKTQSKKEKEGVWNEYRQETDPFDSPPGWGPRKGEREIEWHTHASP